VQNEIEEMDALISCGKDNLIKIWNIRTQECIQTISDLIHKISEITLIKDLIILGCYDNKLRIYQIHGKNLIGNEKLPNYVTLRGLITRKSGSKIIDFSISSDKKLLSVLSDDSNIEFFKILNDKELKERMISLEKSKLVKKEKLLNGEDKIKEIKERVKTQISNNDFNFKFKFFSLFNFMNEAKIKSMFFLNKKHDNNRWEYGIALDNNSVEVYELKTKLINENLFDLTQEKELTFDESNLSVNKNYSIDNYGHRDILRYVKFGDNDSIFMTSSNDSVKLWNLSTKSPIKTIELTNIISGFFLFNDRYVVLGSRKGHISIYETNSLNLVVNCENVHTGEIWSMCKLDFNINKNQMIILSGSTDKTIKYWKIKCNSDKIFFKKMANVTCF
jgi:U3 small nucleolar RNA-associated protein 12